ncbi:hypothetical protein LL13F58_24080 [Escherichia coli]
MSVGRCHSRVQLANSHLVDVDETPPSSAAVHLYATDAGSIVDILHALNDEDPCYVQAVA